jgi:hypothetical protein
MTAPLTSAELDELAAFLDRWRKTWKDRNAEGRRELARRTEEVIGGMFSDFMWKGQYEALRKSYDSALASEIGEALFLLRRVRYVLQQAGTHKTLRTDDLKVALSRCETCEKPAELVYERRPACKTCADYMESEKQRRLALTSADKKL